jgi:NodT family efflux transporter outer membrane factor (OMF) lipoprotein
MRGDSHTNLAIPGWLLTGIGTASLLGALLALGGCAVGPNFKKPPVSVNKSWSAQGDPRLTDQTTADGLWWKTFNDPVLDRLVDLAVKQNLPLQVAGLRILEARAQLGITSGNRWPQTQALTANAAAIGLTNQMKNVFGIDRTFFNYQIGFDAAWELDFWGKFRRNVEAQSAALLVTVADYYSAVVSLTAEVARTYALVRTYDVLVDQAELNVKLQEAGLQIADSRFRNGATSELDVAQATTLLESTRASIPQLQIQGRQSRNALSTLLGQTTGSVDAMLEGPKEIPKAPPTVAVSVPAEMLRRRPDVRSAEFQAAAQCARIGVAKSQMYPSLSLVGSFGLRANTAGLGPQNLFNSNAGFFVFGPSFNWPIFNYGRLRNNVRVEDARLQQSIASYQHTVLKAAQEVEDALTGFLRSQEATDIQQRSVGAAQRAQELSMKQYQEGATDYQRVLDAQRFLLQQQNSLAQIRSAVATNLVALYKALGGGWEVRQDQPIVPDHTQKEMADRTNWNGLMSPNAPENKKQKQSEKH